MARIAVVVVIVIVALLAIAHRGVARRVFRPGRVGSFLDRLLGTGRNNVRILGLLGAVAAWAPLLAGAQLLHRYDFATSGSANDTMGAAHGTIHGTATVSGGALNTTGATEAITVKVGADGGGMTFQLGTDSTTRSTVGIDSVATYRLGGGDAGATLNELKSGGDADLQAHSANSLKAVRKAITQVAAAKGRIGGFQKFQVQTSANSLTQLQESLSTAKSVIADTDYALASAELNRQSVLLNSGISLLGLANQQAAQILSLLG